MKRLIQIAARLYPAAWRKRYGNEFEALIEDARPGLGGALDILDGALTMQLSSWTPLRVLAASIVGGVLIAMGIASTIPKMWPSRAVILTKSGREDPGKTMQSVLSSTVLNELIVRQGLYPGDDQAVLEMRRAITVKKARSISADSEVLLIQFAYQDPQRAQQVTQALANRIVESEPDVFQLADRADLPEQPIPTIFAAKTSGAGLGGGLLIGGPAALVLYWRRRK